MNLEDYKSGVRLPMLKNGLESISHLIADNEIELERLAKRRHELEKIIRNNDKRLAEIVKRIIEEKSKILNFNLEIYALYKPLYFMEAELKEISSLSEKMTIEINKITEKMAYYIKRIEEDKKDIPFYLKNIEKAEKQLKGGKK